MRHMLLYKSRSKFSPLNLYFLLWYSFCHNTYIEMESAALSGLTSLVTSNVTNGWLIFQGFPNDAQKMMLYIVIVSLVCLFCCSVSVNILQSNANHEAGTRGVFKAWLLLLVLLLWPFCQLAFFLGISNGFLASFVAFASQCLSCPHYFWCTLVLWLVSQTKHPSSTVICSISVSHFIFIYCPHS